MHPSELLPDHETQKKRPYKCTECDITFFRTHNSLDIKESIQEENHANVTCVARLLIKLDNLQFIEEFILERNHINVMYVARLLFKLETLQFIRIFVL